MPVELKKETCCHDEMKPCPFCGEPPEMNCWSTLTRIKCNGCDYNLHGHGAESDEQVKEGICYLDIVRRWNTRV